MPPIESHYPLGAEVVTTHQHEGVFIGVSAGSEPLLQFGGFLGLFIGPEQAREFARQLEAEAAAWEE